MTYNTIPYPYGFGFGLIGLSEDEAKDLDQFQRDYIEPFIKAISDEFLNEEPEDGDESGLDEAPEEISPFPPLGSKICVYDEEDSQVYTVVTGDEETQGYLEEGEFIATLDADYDYPEYRYFSLDEEGETWERLPEENTTIGAELGIANDQIEQFNDAVKKLAYVANLQYEVKTEDAEGNVFAHPHLVPVPNAVDPEHYKFGNAEVIDIVRHLDYPTGNVIKYAARAGRKDPAKRLEDLLKAQKYLNWAIEDARGQ